MCRGTLSARLRIFGNNFLVFVSDFLLSNGQPQVLGITVDPFSNSLSGTTSGTAFARPNANVGPINQFETIGRSRYDSLQVALRGRLAQRFQYQTSYVFGEVKDDVLMFLIWQARTRFRKIV